MRILRLFMRYALALKIIDPTGRKSDTFNQLALKATLGSSRQPAVWLFPT